MSSYIQVHTTNSKVEMLSIKNMIENITNVSVETCQKLINNHILYSLKVDSVNKNKSSLAVKTYLSFHG